MHLTFRRWVLWWASAGLCIPLLLILRWKRVGAPFGELELILWPGSLILMGLEGQHSVLQVAEVYVIAFMVSIVAYCTIGILSWPLIRRIVRRRS